VALLTGHADASEGARVVQAGAVVLTRMRLALIHVRLAARSREALRAVAGKRARRVDAHAVVLTWGPLLTLVDVLAAVHPLVAARTRASVRSVDGTSVTNSIGMARVRRAGVVQVTQESCRQGHRTNKKLWL
jgi:hypothetical protein